jgi:ribulose bisphosphate carboxylase small subunit
MNTQIETRTAEQVLQELNDCDGNANPEEFIRLHAEWRYLCKLEAGQS